MTVTAEHQLPLEATGITVGYSGNAVVHDIDLEVRRGEVVALLGANGVGKTTTLMGLAGVLHPLSGTVQLDGRPAPSRVHERAKAGLGYVTEERSVITSLSVADNLRLARADRDLSLSVFPELRPLLAKRAGLLSGGEQQMLTVGRALGRRPKVLIADELSLGLAPKIVTRLLRTLREAADGGIGVLIVEQHIEEALAVADRFYAMRQGRIVLSGTAQEARSRRAELEDIYLGGVGARG